MKRKIIVMLSSLLTVVMLLCSCGTKSNQSAQNENNKEVNLVWYFVGNSQKDLQLVNEKVNEITKREINATVDLKLLDWNAYDQKMNMTISTGEEFDLCWTAPQLNDYYTNVARNAFIPLDNLLQQYGKETFAGVPKEYWEATKINGHIYGIINYQVVSTAYGFATPRSLADESGINYADIKNYTELEPYLSYIKENHSELIPLGYSKTQDPFSSQLPAFGFDVLGDSKTPGVIRFDDESMKVINQYDTNEFRQLINTMRDWYQKGYLKADASTSEEYTSDTAAGKYGVLWPSFMLSDTIEDDRRPNEPYGNTGVPHYTKKFTNTIVSTDRVLATMTAISATSKNPERAMMLIELVNTNSELYNLLCHGIEGKHYNKVDYFNEIGAHIQVEPIENSGYKPNTYWMFGNTANAMLTSVDVPAEYWEKYNEESEVSPTLGFSFDSTPVSNEIAMCSSVVDEYLNSLVSGSVEIESRYNEFLEKLNMAGAEKIVNEKQKQLEAWMQAKDQ